jgi:hypothetical protein
VGEIKPYVAGVQAPGRVFEWGGEGMIWINVTAKMPEPGVMVLAYGRNECGKHRRIRAMWAKAFTVEAEYDDEGGDYDEEKDIYYIAEGWYEENDCEDTHWRVMYPITHWMPLPEVPLIARSDLGKV